MQITDYPLPELPSYKEWEKRFEIENEVYDKLAQEDREADERGEYVGALITFPVADGSAIYRVASLSPLVVQHVGLGDSYNFDRYVIKLNRDELKEEVDRQRKFRNLFGG